MKHPIPRFIFWLAVIACVVYATGCASTWRAVKTGGPAAIGGGVGALAGGPLGAAAGAAAGGAIAQSVSENDELRDGTLVGEKTIVKYITREVPVEHEVEVPRVPLWIKWLAWIGAASILWLLYKLFWRRYRTQFLTAIGKLLTLRLPSALDAMHKASGAKHSREIRTGGE